MSPEHAREGPLSPASDWYSVGVLLHQALTGAVPFRGSRTELVLQHQRAQVGGLSNVPIQVPVDLATLCSALLAIEPRERAGAAEIRHVLGRPELLPPGSALHTSRREGPESTHVGTRERTLMPAPRTRARSKRDPGPSSDSE